MRTAICVPIAQPIGLDRMSATDKLEVSAGYHERTQDRMGLHQPEQLPADVM